MRVAIIIVAIAFGAGLAWYLWPEAESAAPAPAASSATTQSLAIPGAAQASPSDTPGESGQPNYIDYRAQLYQSTDILAFMQMLLERANSGDVAAKYWLWATLPMCQREYDMVFLDMDYEEMSLDEALQQHSSAPKFDPDEIRRLYDKCHRAREAGFEQFGDEAKLLEAASDGGYPLGQVVWASELVRDARPFSATPSLAEDSLADARALAIKALQTGDPEVVRQAGRLAYQMHADDDDESAGNRAARTWIMAACLRGAACGPQAEWVKYLCRSDAACQPFENGLDIFRRQTGPEYDELERRALEINALMNDGRWDEIAFD